jgi:pimeloyl-ACP methyl ester carboxylesterase
LAPALRSSAQSAGQAPPPPVDVALTTKDSLQLKITYYPSNAGQEAVPVIMLHDYLETRAVFKQLAIALQNPPRTESPATPKMASRAVITVDLRGHGESKSAVAPDGTTMEVDANRFKLQDYQSMVVYDLEAVRSFLVEQNDAGALNLNKLCLLGCGMGANVGILWAARDWATPPLAVRKQGQDVKALVLLSPRWNYNGLILVDAMRFPPVQTELSIFLAYGARNRDIAKDGETLRKIWARHHPEPPADQVQQLKSFYLVAQDTELQGSKLLTRKDIGPKVASFIEARLGRQSIPWIQRKKP